MVKAGQDLPYLAVFDKLTSGLSPSGSRPLGRARADASGSKTAERMDRMGVRVVVR